MLTWMACSIAIILFNKLVLFRYGFNFPMALTLFHCAANSVVLFVLFECVQILPSPYRQQNAAAVLASVAPIAALFAVSTILRNYAFLYLPVSTIQLLSSGSPVINYALACATRLDVFRPRRALTVAVIAAGCAWATSGSIATLAFTSYAGLVFQVCGLLVEACRGVLLKKAMVQSATPSSLGLLYMVAPVAFAMLVVPAASTELREAVAFVATRGSTFQMLLGINIVMAVCLNLSSYFFVKTCAVTTTSIAALVKDGVLILGSCAVHPDKATGPVIAGYGVTLVGILCYTTTQQQPA